MKVVIKEIIIFGIWCKGDIRISHTFGTKNIA